VRWICLDFSPKVKRNRAVLINRSRRKRVAGRKRHPETDKASSPANTSVGERYRDIRAMHRSFWLFSGAPSEENKREGTFYAWWFLRSSGRLPRIGRPIESILTDPASIRSPFLAVSSDLTIPAEQIHVPARAYFRSGRKHCLRRFQHPFDCRIARILSESDRLAWSLTLVSFAAAIWDLGLVPLFLRRQISALCGVMKEITFMLSN